MADIVPTLFGITPEMYDQSQQARIDQQALQYAKLNPFERASFGISRGANMLGGALGRNLGGEDPERRKIQLQQQILGSLDLGNPTSLIEGARQANSMGLPQLASTLVDRSKALQESIALTQQRLAAAKASLAAAGRERMQADPEKVRLAREVALLSGPEGSIEYNTAYAESLKKQMTPAEKIVPPKIDKIGVAGGSNKAVFLDVNNDLQFIYDKDASGKQVRVPYTGPVDQTISKVTATATAAGSKKGAEAIAELDSKRLNTAQVASGKAVEQAGLLQELLKTPQPISGSGAPARVGALRVFSTFGLTSSKDDEALGNADKFNALAGERVISFIKALGSNPTDTDREFARTIGPALEKGTKTNTDLINFLLERSRKVVVDASEMEKHFYENDYSLRGFKSPFLTDIEKPKPSNMSAEDLAKAAGGKIVNGKFVKD